MTRGILYFTDNEIPEKLDIAVKDLIKMIKLPLVSSTRKPITDMGLNVVTDEPRGYRTMFKQILNGLEALKTDVVFMAEHDVMYPKEHFDFIPPDKSVYYDHNWWKVRKDGLAIHWDADQVSGMCAYRNILIDYYTHKIKDFDNERFNRKFEPFSRLGSKSWKASVPHIDVRHDKNLTKSKWSIDDFRDKSTAKNLETSTIESIQGWDVEEIRKVLNG